MCLKAVIMEKCQVVDLLSAKQEEATVAFKKGHTIVGKPSRATCAGKGKGGELLEPLRCGSGGDGWAELTSEGEVGARWSFHVWSQLEKI